MNLDEYVVEWKKDAPIPPDDLDASARQVPLLHAKWWEWYAQERLKLRQAEVEWKRTARYKWDWYAGKLVDEQRLALGWPPNPLKLVTTAIPRALESDTEMMAIERLRIKAEETLKFLEDVIKQINNRGYHISNAIQFLKFKMGM